MMNWNSEPYNDDFDEGKKFLKILFRPGKAVQTRELNQIQTILQNQIARHGDHIFKQGAMVIPGQASVDKEIHFIRLKDANTRGKSVNSVVELLIGKDIKGSSVSGGLVAEVIYATKRTADHPATLFVRYKNSGDTQQKTFSVNEVLAPVDADTNVTLDLSVDCASDAEIIDGVLTPVFGKGCISSIKKGIYYVNGFFVLVEDQTIILDKYSNTPSYRIGLKIVEEIVKPEQDSSLLDNSQNTQNFAAPGAHRYAIDLVLEKRALDSTDDKDFIELVRTDAGISTKEIRSTEYSILEQTLARRTYDESGDYVVRDFNIDIREDRTNDRGAWIPGTYLYGDVVSHAGNTYVCKKSGISSDQPNAQIKVDGIVWKLESNPYYNRGVSKTGSEDMLSIGVEPGKAYVQGYEIEKIATEFVKIPKARTFKSANNAIIPASIGNYIIVTNVSGAPDVINFSKVNIIQGSTVFGTCRIRSIEKHDSSSFKLFLFDITLSQPLNTNAYTISNSSGFTCTVPANGFQIKEPQNASLLFPLPYYAIKSVNHTETIFSITQKFTATVNTNVARVYTTGEDVFASVADEGNYLVFDAVTNAVLSNYEMTLENSQTTLKLAFSGGTIPTSVIIFATVRKSSGVRKTKTLNSSIETFVLQAQAQSNTLNLDYADGYRLVSVKMDPRGFGLSGSPQYTVDITDRYIFNDGQTDTHYGMSSLTKKGSYASPSGPIQITYEYFEHSQSGDYFTLDSYEGQVDYKEIPFYKNIPLRDCFDFRPVLVGSTFQSAVVPKRGVDIITDFEYYIGRKAKLCLDNTGKFGIVDGEPSLSPGEPEAPKLSMVLYDFELEPYTFGTLETNIKRNRVDNRRYTMRDIGKLEKRIDNLEYYTTLSLLEQQTHASPVIDADGLDRLKNGFIVDSFSGHGVGDTQNPDYLCSVDMQNGILRPFFAMHNINLVENASTSAERATAGYNLYGDVITLPVVDHVTLAEQPYASRTENVNPFAIFTFLGDVKITPFSDEWFETERKPDIINNIEGNFNTLLSLSESAGVLGTVWNSWQTVWTGTPTRLSTRSENNTIQAGGESLASFNERFGAGVDRRPEQLIGSTEFGRRSVTLETVANDVGQSRNGIRTSIVAKVDREVVEDRTVSTAVIPFIRSRNVLIQVKGLKPSTRFYPFFDDVDVSQYCQSATWIQYTLSSSVDFDASSNAGNQARESARQIDGDTQVCLNTGDVIKSGNVTAVVVGKHQSGNNKYLHVLNIKGGSFASGGQISAVESISKATGTIVSVQTQNTLTTTPKGDLNLIFNIPNTNAVRFRTGTREFKLIDSATNSNEFTSKGVALYQAKGVIETKQSTINSVRNADIVRETVSDTRTIVQTSERPIGDTGWYDPLAQTFLVQNKGGAFISKVDVFFSDKDENIPVTMEIREVVNGYPGKRVLPFSRVTLSPDQVNLSSTTVMVDGVSVRKYDTPTTFEFRSPVYVNDIQEYCLVLLSDSNKYKVWISQIGDSIPDSDRTISEQPYAGVLFKSQNASTWTADQYQDLKFKIYRAKFDTSKVSQVTFVNDLVPYQNLELDPIQFKALTNIIRVFQKDHGFKAGDQVTLSGVAANGTVTINGQVKPALNGIALEHINKTHTIPSSSNNTVQLDSYVLVLSSAENGATLSGYFGGSAVRTNRHYKYNSVQPIVSVQTLPDTSVLYNMKTTNYVTGNMETTPVAVLANENNTFFDSTKVIKSGNSCEFVCRMFSDNESLSPIIDTHRTSMVLVENKINAPTIDNTNYGGFDSLGESYYVADTNPLDSSTYSNYVTRRIRLLNPSELLKVQLAANVPSLADVELYYRVTPAGSTTDISSLDWTLLTTSSSIVKVANGNETFYDISYIKEDIGSFDSVQIKIAMKSADTSAVPKIKDLRVIACA